MSRLACTAFALGLAAAASGCTPPTFEAITAPAPFAQGELCDSDPGCGGGRTITLSKGFALAFECTASSGDPCTGVGATAEDPGIVRVFPGYLDTLSPGDAWDSVSAQPRSTLVVVGAEVGDTTLTISTDSGDVDFDVSIVPL